MSEFTLLNKALHTLKYKIPAKINAYHSSLYLLNLEFYEIKESAKFGLIEFNNNS
jgi:hypothetical protein